MQANDVKNAKVALFLADGCEEIEALTVYDLLFRSSIPVTLISITDSLLVTSSHGVRITADTTIGDIDFDEFDMLVLPGGLPGTTNLGSCTLLTDKVKEFYACGKQIAAICAAPSVFAKLGLLDGRKATCNPSFENVLAENGALLTKEAVTVSDNVTTSQGMGTAIAFGLSIVEHYKGKKAADDLGRKVLYYR